MILGCLLRDPCLFGFGIGVFQWIRSALRWYVSIRPEKLGNAPKHPKMEQTGTLFI